MLRPRARADQHARPSGNSEQDLRRARKRFVRRQRARRWLAWRRILAAVLGATVLGGSVYLLFFSPVLAVSEITVAGTDVLETDEVRRVAAAPLGKPLATTDLDAIADRIGTLPAVKSVDVSRSWPDGVRIAIRERQAVAVVERNGELRGLDAEGVLFRSYPTAPRSLPAVSVNADTSNDALAEAARVVAALPVALAAQVDLVQVDTIDTISLRLRTGRTVFWGSAENSVAKARVVAVLLGQRATAYDVSVPAQPTIRR